MESASTQLNLRLTNSFLDTVKTYADTNGYLSIQELIRETLRERILDTLEYRPEFVKEMLSKEANTFLSKEESKEFLEELKKRVKDVKNESL